MKYLYLIAVVGVITAIGIATANETENPHGKLAWECNDCHTTASWHEMRSDANFDHAKTGFRLDGSHQQASCIGCHKSLIFNRVSTSCIDCHQDHHQEQLGNNCAECHTPRDWQPRRDLLLQHAERGFPLTGVHAVADCESCHSGREQTEYVGTPTACEACHQSDLARATSPDHMQLAFNTDCERCHHAAFATWTRTTYEHPGAFPLTGAHRLLDCSACHASGFESTPNLCNDCHSAAFAATTDPNHQEAGFSADCENCHNTSAWEPAIFDHNATAFPLTGIHLTATCSSCHETGYAGTSTLCYSCHQSAYEATTDPNHVSAGIPTDCEMCHTTSAWEPASFDHNATAFPLTGKHQTTACIACHASGFAGTPTLCYSCHQSAYEATTNPNHVDAGITTDCETCHTTNSWQPASFDHNLTLFPLTGRHLTLTCIRCHAGGYTGTPVLCYSCHQSAYESTADPNHANAGFPTDCETCHTTFSWQPANWDHDALYFPINSGAHNGRWGDCSTCHTIPTDFSLFDCTTCHEHNQTDMDAHHSGVQNYEYASTACYSCHPRGTH